MSNHEQMVRVKVVLQLPPGDVKPKCGDNR